MSSANKYLRLILFWQGLGYIVLAIPWIFDETAGRLIGVAWLEAVFALVPYLTVDDKVGILWAVGGVLMILGGTNPSRRRKSLETIGYVAGITVPLLTALVFMVAFLFADAQNGYISAIAYTLYTVPLLAYLRVKPQDVTTHTSSMDAIGARDDEQ